MIPKSHILIVDDVMINIQLVGSLLEEEGYQVSFANDGATALASVEKDRPDLIFLDINMPEMDGFEVCKRIKSSPNHIDIPIIFLTSHDNADQIEKAFDLGAVDYVTKPFRFKEVKARLETHLSINHYQKVIELKNKKLEHALFELERKNKDLAKTLNELNTTQEELIQSEKMAALGRLVANFAHEANTPLGVLKASINNCLGAINESFELLPELFKVLSEEQVKQFSQLLKASVDSKEKLSIKEKRKLVKRITAELEAHFIGEANFIADRLVDMGIHKDIDRFIHLFGDNNRLLIINSAYNLSFQQRNYMTMNLAIDRMSKTVFTLKAYSRGERQEPMINVDITEGMRTVLSLYQSYFNRGIHLETNFQPVPKIWCFPNEMVQVWTNLIHNAIQSMANEGKLTISIFPENEHIMVHIKDNGPGIPENLKHKIFQPFFTTKRMGEGSGLGLDIIQRIVKRHNGKIDFQSKPEETTFIVILPINK